MDCSQANTPISRMLNKRHLMVLFKQQKLSTKIKVTLACTWTRGIFCDHLSIKNLLQI